MFCSLPFNVPQNNHTNPGLENFFCNTMNVKQPVKLNELKTPVWQVKAHEQWVKTVLISDIVESGDKVCELCCGKGLDIGKWVRGKIGEFTGVDSNNDLLNEARERWVQKKTTITGNFIETNIYTSSLEAALPNKDIMFDTICCFNGMQYSFEDKEKAKLFLQNVVCRLKPGGYFFGLLPDSSAIWYKAQSGKPAFKGELYSIDFANDEFKHFGTRYTFKMDGESEVQEFLVHFPTLINLAEEAGLTMLEISNLNEFYEENKKNYGEQLKQLGVLNKQQKIENNQKEIISLFTTFIFKKKE